MQCHQLSLVLLYHKLHAAILTRFGSCLGIVARMGPFPNAGNKLSHPLTKTNNQQSQTTTTTNEPCAKPTLFLLSSLPPSARLPRSGEALSRASSLKIHRRPLLHQNNKLLAVNCRPQVPTKTLSDFSDVHLMVTARPSRNLFLAVLTLTARVRPWARRILSPKVTFCQRHSLFSSVLDLKFATSRIHATRSATLVTPSSSSVILESSSRF